MQMLVSTYLEFVRALAYMAFQSVFFGFVGAWAAGGNTGGEGAWVAELSKLVPARAFIMFSDGRLAAVDPNAAAPSDGAVIFCSMYWSKLFMFKPCRTPIDGERFEAIPYVVEGSAGAPGFPPAPNPR